MMKEGVFSEKNIRLKTTSGVWFTGAMDVYDSRAEIPTIYDFKSKSNLNFILNEYQLAGDFQLAIYTLWVMYQKQCHVVDIVHVYVLRDEKQPEVKIVRARVTKEEVLDVWMGVMDTVEEIVKLLERGSIKLLEVPGNDQSCFLYNKPCHNLDQCETQSPLVGLRKKKPLTETTEMPNVAPEDDDSMLAELRRKKQVRDSAPPVATRQLELPGTEDEAPDADEVGMALARIKAKVIKLDGSGHVFTKEGAAQGWVLRPPTAAELEAFKQFAGENMLEIKLPIAKPKQESSLLAPGHPSRDAVPEETKPAPKEAKPAEPKAEKRPPKKKAEAAESAEAAVMPVAEGGPKVKLYVDCSPIGRVVPRYSEWVKPIEDEVAAKNKVAYWNLIEYHATGIIFDAIRAKLDTLPKELIMFSNEPTGAIFISACAGRVEVVKGW